MPSSLRRSTAIFISLSLLLAVPSRAKDNLSLDDLGFTPSQTQSDEKLQALLHRRSRMLKTHQVLGLATLVPLAATVALAGGADGSKASRDRHMIAGMAAAGFYFTAASFAIFAPEPPDEKPARGGIRLHKALAFIHFPAMILTPIAGMQAKKQRDRGEEVHGLAKMHQTFAGTALGAFGLAMITVTFNFGGPDK